MGTKDILKEYRRYTGIITEADDSRLVQDILPGVRNAAEHCEEACEEMRQVMERLEKVAQALKADNNSLHLPAESNYLSGLLRSTLRHILSSELPIRKALAALDQMG